MRHVVTVTLVVVSLIHLLPLTGVLGSDRLAALYGIQIADTDLLILMRHRAVLFGILGVLFLAAAFKPALQATAFAAGFVSVASFLLLAWLGGDHNAHIGRVVVADLVALVCLVIGLAAWMRGRKSP